MPKFAHRIAGILAPLCIATFFLSTILVELFGSHTTVAQLKSLIVTPGLWILIPAMAAAGGSGMLQRQSPVVPRCRRQRKVAIEVAQGQAGECQEKTHAFHRGQWPAGTGALRDPPQPLGRGWLLRHDLLCGAGR